MRVWLYNQWYAFDVLVLCQGFLQWCVRSDLHGLVTATDLVAALARGAAAAPAAVPAGYGAE